LDVVSNKPTDKPAANKFKKQRNKTRVMEEEKKEEEKDSEPE